jgi:hypothetical protein
MQYVRRLPSQAYELASGAYNYLSPYVRPLIQDHQKKVIAAVGSAITFLGNYFKNRMEASSFKTSIVTVLKAYGFKIKDPSNEKDFIKLLETVFGQAKNGIALQHAHFEVTKNLEMLVQNPDTLPEFKKALIGTNFREISETINPVKFAIVQSSHTNQLGKCFSALNQLNFTHETCDKLKTDYKNQSDECNEEHKECLKSNTKLSVKLDRCENRGVFTMLLRSFKGFWRELWKKH